MGGVTDFFTLGGFHKFSLKFMKAIHYYNSSKSQESYGFSGRPVFRSFLWDYEKTDGTNSLFVLMGEVIRQTDPDFFPYPKRMRQGTVNTDNVNLSMVKSVYSARGSG